MIATDRSGACSCRIAALPVIAVLAAFALLLVAPVAPAAAASKWVGPTSILGTADEPYEVQTAIAPDGEMLTVWTTVYGATGQHVLAASRPPGGEWSPPQLISGAQSDEYELAVALGADGSAVVAWEVRLQGAGVVEATTRSADGVWAPTKTFGEGNFFLPYPTVAVGSAGEAVVAWDYCDQNPGSLELQAATSIDGHWSAATKVPGSLEIFGSPSLAAGPEAGVVAAWVTSPIYAKVSAATMDSTGNWQWPHTIAGLGGHSYEQFVEVRVSSGPEDSPVAAWTTSVGEESEEGVVETSTLEAGTWSAPKALSVLTPGRPPYSISLAVGSDGAAAAAWAVYPTAEIEGSARPVGGTWSTEATLTAPGEGGDEPQVAVGGDGSTTALWTTPAEAAGVPPRAVHYEGGSWSPPEALPDGIDGFAARPNLVADAEGDAFAVWHQSGATNLESSVYDVIPPILENVSIPTGGTVGEALGFSAAASDRWSGPPSLTWSFGDGTSSSGGNVTHAYSAGGSYEVTVTATDGAGNTATERGTVVVPAAAPPAPSPGPGPSLPAPPTVIRHPAVKITHRPGHGGGKGAGKGKPRYAFRFYDETPGATYLCSLDGKPFSPCSSPKVYGRLKPAMHVFRVKSVDAAGVESAIQTVKFLAGRRHQGDAR